MKIVTWNVDFKHRLEIRLAALHYAVDTLAADVAFFQEAPDPSTLEVTGRWLWSPIGSSSLWSPAKRTWGTAIWVRAGRLEEVAFDNSYPGWLRAAAYWPQPDARPLLLIAVHTTCHEGDSHEMVSRVSRLLNGRDWHHYRGRPLTILGGDFNNSRQMDRRWGGRDFLTLTHRLQDQDLCDVMSTLHNGHHQPTFRNHRRGGPEDWQLDHLFVSKRLFTGARCRAWENDTIRSMSDHNPLVLDLPAALSRAADARRAAEPDAIPVVAATAPGVLPPQ